MIIWQRIAGVGLVGAACYATATPALAHHMMDGQLSATFAQGFLSGVGHPIIGIDHFLFIVGVGLLAGFMGRRLLPPLAFVLGTWGGAAVHLFGLNIAFAEIRYSRQHRADGPLGHWQHSDACAAHGRFGRASIRHGHSRRQTSLVFRMSPPSHAESI